MYTVKGRKELSTVKEMAIISYYNVLRLPSNKRKIVVIILKLASYIGSRFLFKPKNKRVLIIFTDKCYF